jgi:type II secretory pathway pseudopilin PulG
MDCHLSSGKRIAKQEGITIVEVLVSLAVIGLFASSAMWALMMMNNRAVVSRLYTGAQTIAQNQIDLMFCDAPYNPQKSQVPSELAVGTQTQTNVPIYTDPATNDVAVAGTVTSTVTDTGTSYGGYGLNVYSITVTVSYQFRGKNYQVTMNTLRTSDV